MTRRSRNLFETVRTEGGLLPPDLLKRISEGDPELGLPPPHAEPVLVHQRVEPQDVGKPEEDLRPVRRPRQGLVRERGRHEVLDREPRTDHKRDQYRNRPLQEHRFVLLALRLRWFDPQLGAQNTCTSFAAHG